MHGNVVLNSRNDACAQRRKTKLDCSTIGGTKKGTNRETRPPRGAWGGPATEAGPRGDGVTEGARPGRRRRLSGRNLMTSDRALGTRAPLSATTMSESVDGLRFNMTSAVGEPRGSPVQQISFGLVEKNKPQKCGISKSALRSECSRGGTDSRKRGFQKTQFSIFVDSFVDESSTALPVSSTQCNHRFTAVPQAKSKHSHETWLEFRRARRTLQKAFRTVTVQILHFMGLTSRGFILTSRSGLNCSRSFAGRSPQNYTAAEHEQFGLLEPP